MRKPVPLLLTALLLMPVLLVSGCATPTPEPSPPSVISPAKRPPLPQEGRAPTPPSICSSTCSDGLTQLRTTLQRTLTDSQ